MTLTKILVRMEIVTIRHCCSWYTPYHVAASGSPKILRNDAIHYGARVPVSTLTSHLTVQMHVKHVSPTDARILRENLSSMRMNIENVAGWIHSVRVRRGPNVPKVAFTRLVLIHVGAFASGDIVKTLEA